MVLICFEASYPLLSCQLRPSDSWNWCTCCSISDVRAAEVLTVRTPCNHTSQYFLGCDQLLFQRPTAGAGKNSIKSKLQKQHPGDSLACCTNSFPSCNWLCWSSRTLDSLGMWKDEVFKLMALPLDGVALLSCFSGRRWHTARTAAA